MNAIGHMMKLEMNRMDVVTANVGNLEDKDLQAVVTQ